jgi:hypothetical protein
MWGCDGGVWRGSGSALGRRALVAVRARRGLHPDRDHGALLHDRCAGALVALPYGARTAAPDCASCVVAAFGPHTPAETGDLRRPIFDEAPPELADVLSSLKRQAHGLGLGEAAHGARAHRDPAGPRPRSRRSGLPRHRRRGRADQDRSAGTARARGRVTRPPIEARVVAQPPRGSSPQVAARKGRFFEGVCGDRPPVDFSQTASVVAAPPGVTALRERERSAVFPAAGRRSRVRLVPRHFGARV